MDGLDRGVTWGLLPREDPSAGPACFLGFDTNKPIVHVRANNIAN